MSDLYISYRSYIGIIGVSHFFSSLDSWTLLFVLSTLSNCHIFSISEIILIYLSILLKEYLE